MIEKYCAFLRGINVNGVKIKMERLKEAFYEMGFSEVQTILATGNVIFTVPEGAGNRTELKSTIEKGLSVYFLYDAHVILRKLEEIKEFYFVSQKNSVQDDCHHYILLCEGDDLPLELKQLFDGGDHGQKEQLILAGNEVFWIVPKGETLNSNFGSKVLGSKKYKDKLTSRNMNTIAKICQ